MLTRHKWRRHSNINEPRTQQINILINRLSHCGWCVRFDIWMNGVCLSNRAGERERHQKMWCWWWVIKNNRSGSIRNKISAVWLPLSELKIHKSLTKYFMWMPLCHGCFFIVIGFINMEIRLFLSLCISISFSASDFTFVVAQIMYAIRPRRWFQF